MNDTSTSPPQEETSEPVATKVAPESAGHRPLSKQLQDLLDSLGGADTTLGAIVDSIGERGFGLLLALLALPAALPVPAPGYATPFGILMIGLGIQMIRGHHQPSLPEKARKRVIRHRAFSATVRGAGLPLKVAEFLVRPRWSNLATHRSMLVLVGAVIVVLAAFMSIPIPLTNTIPSFAIFLLACGLLEKDGLVLLGGLLAAPVGAAVAMIALYFAWTYGLDMLDGGLSPLLDRIFSSG
ncbi:MAG: exopolysaccharide biosynthesis protein [Deltaproteobacteria bacterium]|nr:exopolysaccharide biosynthesis protein [Deltaproteobacteria bacterium]